MGVLARGPQPARIVATADNKVKTAATRVRRQLWLVLLVLIKVTLAIA